MDVLSISLYTVITYYLLGLMGAFAPCAYPMLPVLIAYLLGGGVKKGRGLVTGLLFSLGLILAVSALGLGTLYAREFANVIIGSFTAEEISSLSLYVIFVVGFSMLTPFKNIVAGISVPLPKVRKGGLFLAFPLGVLFFLASAPCDGAYVVALALNAAATAHGNAFLIVTILSTVFALGMSTPFFVMSLAATGAMNVYKKISKSVIVKRGGELLGLALIAYSFFSLKLVGGDIGWIIPHARYVSNILWMLSLAYFALSSLKVWLAAGLKAPFAIGLGTISLLLGEFSEFWGFGVDATINIPLHHSQLTIIMTLPEALSYAGSILIILGILSLCGKAFGAIALNPDLTNYLLPDAAVAITWLTLFLVTKSSPVLWAASAFGARSLARFYWSSPLFEGDFKLLFDLLISAGELTASAMLLSLASKNYKYAREISILKRERATPSEQEASYAFNEEASYTDSLV